MTKKINFIFFGGGDFSVKILEILCQNNFTPKLIITTPDKPKGRKMIITPPPVKSWAQKNNIKIYQQEKLDIRNLKLEIGEINLDFAVIAAFGKIIPKNILDIPKYGTINVHPSLLPKFRGPSPIQSFILSGEEQTGVTLMLTDEQVDHGPIVAKSNLKSQISNLYYKELEEKLAELGGEMLVEIIPKWVKNETPTPKGVGVPTPKDVGIKPAAQNHSQATFTKKITKQDGLIDLEKDAPEIIERKIRAFTPWPGAYTFISNKRLIIAKAELTDSGLKILRLKPEGKNEMSFEDYLRGNPNKTIGKYL